MDVRPGNAMRQGQAQRCGSGSVEVTGGVGCCIRVVGRVVGGQFGMVGKRFQHSGLYRIGLHGDNKRPARRRQSPSIRYGWR